MNECGHYQQFFQGKPLPCAACSKAPFHRVVDRASTVVSFSPFNAGSMPATRAAPRLVTFDRRKVRVETSVWVTDSEPNEQLARHALRHELGEPTRDELELRQVLGDAALESAMVQRFGERLRAHISMPGRSCACGERNGCHKRWCVEAELLREMLGPEETQRQVDAAHEEATLWAYDLSTKNIFRREYLGTFPTGRTATEILLREEELLSQAGFMSAAERDRAGLPVTA